MILASYSGCNTDAVVILFTASMGLMGAFYPGMKVNALDLSGNYAGTIMAIVNGIGAITGIIAPYLVGLLTPDVSTGTNCVLYCNVRLLGKSNAGSLRLVLATKRL